MSTSSPTNRLSPPPISESTILRGDRSRPRASRFARLSDFVVEHSTDWIRVGTVLFVLLASAVLAFKGSAQQLMYVFVAMAGVLGLLIFLQWPGLGMIAIPLSGMFIHYIGPGGVNATMGLVALMLVVWVVNMVVFRQDIRIVASHTMAPIIAMMVAVTISFGMGQLPWFSFVRSAPLDAQLGGYAVYFLSFGAFLAVANQIKDLRWLKWLVWSFLLFGGFYAMGLVVPGLKNLTRALMGNMGSLFWIWITAVAYSQALFNRDLSKGWRGVLMGIVVASLYLLFTLKFKDKSGWLPVVIVLWAITALRSWQLGIVLLVGGIFGALALLPQVLLTEDYSLATRLEVLPILAQIVKVNPIFGVGFANYYFYTPLFSLRGFYVSFNSHNNYADLVVQTGLIGTMIYVWLMAQIAFLAWKLRTRVRGGFSEAYVNGAMGGLVGMIVVGFLGDWVLPFVYNIGLLGFRTSVEGWLFLGGLVVLEQIFASPAQVTQRAGAVGQDS